MERLSKMTSNEATAGILLVAMVCGLVVLGIFLVLAPLMLYFINGKLRRANELTATTHRLLADLTQQHHEVAIRLHNQIHPPKAERQSDPTPAPTFRSLS